MLSMQLKDSTGKICYYLHSLTCLHGIHVHNFTKFFRLKAIHEFVHTLLKGQIECFSKEMKANITAHERDARTSYKRYFTNTLESFTCFCHAHSLPRVRCSPTFTWWMKCNARLKLALRCKSAKQIWVIKCITALH